MFLFVFLIALILLIASLGAIAIYWTTGFLWHFLIGALVLGGSILGVFMLNQLVQMNRMIDRTLPEHRRKSLLFKTNKLLDIADFSSQKRYSEEILQKQIHIEALQSQINPHFLYNTLDSIRGQALMDDTPTVADMAEALSMMFRYSISQTGNFVQLHEELRNADHYLMLQRFRFENRFTVLKKIEDDSLVKYYVPRMTIQPIVENAVFHGLETKLHGGVITIRVYSSGQQLIIRISDNGVGMSAEDLQKLNIKLQKSPMQPSSYIEMMHHQNGGLALTNVNQRIRLTFGESYGICAYSTPAMGTDIEVILPLVDNLDMLTSMEDKR
ncbi:MAG: sensor histidine kinase [Christensenellales bacterium]